MLDALWSVRFISNSMSTGAGVIIIKNGKIVGGDSQYYYIGELTLTDDIVNAEVTATIHTRIPGLESVFGQIDSFVLGLSGKAKPKEINLTGTMLGSPTATINIVCTRLTDLPF